MPSSVRSRASAGLRSKVRYSFGVPRNSPTTRRPSATLSSVASSSATRTGLLCGTIGPSTATFIFFRRAAMYAPETAGAGVRIRGE